MYLPTHRVFPWLAGLLVGMAGQLTAPAKAEVYVGSQVPRGLQISLEQIDHAPFDKLLKEYVDQAGFVNYAGWKRSAADGRVLDQYLAALSRGNPDLPASPKAAKAFWINAYNAVTIKGILREYPTTSIRNHTAKLFGYNIWDDLLLHVGDQAYSLRQIENDILRKTGDFRIHYAIVCASIGCPKLRNEAYTAERLDQQLATNAKEFFAKRSNFRYDANSQTFYLSSIQSWYASDFGRNQSAQLRAIAPYLPSRAAQQAAKSGRGSLSYLDYDWGLNDQATANRSRTRR